MRSTFIDFVRSRRQPGLRSYLVLAFGVAALASVAIWDLEYWQVLARIDADRLRAARVSLETRKAEPPALAGTQLVAEWSRAMAVAGDLNRPWEALFAALEAETGRPVALLSLEPDVVKGEIVLSAEAKDLEAMLDYFRLLQKKENLRDVVLHTHRVNQQDKDKPVRFRVTAKWVTTS